MGHNPAENLAGTKGLTREVEKRSEIKKRTAPSVGEVDSWKRPFKKEGK